MKIPPVTAPPFFIVGAGRSGTTLLRLMLCGHARIHVPPEAWFLGDVMWRLPVSEPLSQQHLAECERLILASDRWRDWNCPADKLHEILQECEGLAQGRMIDRLVRCVFELPEAVRWGEKTPKHSYIVDRIGQIFPQSQFIHLIRDGRDVVTSMLARGWFGASPRRVSEHWETCVRGAAEAAKFGADRYLEVRFEALLADPDAQIREICRFLRIDFDPRMLAYREQVRRLVPAGEASYHHKLNSGLSNAEVGKWRASLDAWREAIFWSVAREQMNAYYSEASVRTKAALFLPVARVSVASDRAVSRVVSKFPRRRNRCREAFRETIASRLQRSAKRALTKPVRRLLLGLPLLPARLARALDDIRFVEPDVLRFIRNTVQPGWCCVDAGAHCGTVTARLARLVGPDGRVIAFEPVEDNAALLAANLRARELLSRCEIVSSALGSADGNTEMVRGEHSTTWKMTNEAGGKETSPLQKVAVSRLDGLLEKRPDVRFVKVDIEGAEVDLVAGAARTLSTVRPIWLFEMHGPSSWSILQDFQRAGYRAFNLDGAEIWSPPTDSCAYGHVVFCPAEKVTLLGPAPAGLS